MVAIAAIAAIVVTSGCSGQSGPADAAAGNAGVVIRRTPDPSGFRGAVPARPYRMPAATLVDTDGRAFRLNRDVDTAAVLVFFGYTHCPDVCPTVLADLSQALRRLDPAVRKDVQVVFVTTDPARDTPDVVRDYVERFDPGFVGLTGEPPEIERAAEALDVPLEGKHKLPGGGYEVGHGAQVIGFGPAGSTAGAAGDRRTGQVVWLTDTPIADLQHDIGKLVAGG